jgi:hypothetical protein
LPPKNTICSFIIICVFEIICNYFNETPAYIKYYFTSFSLDFIEKAKISDNTSRIYGPCLNSSITGVWAVLFFLILNFDKEKFNLTNLSKKKCFLFSILLLIIIFSAASGTAFFVLIVGLLSKIKYCIKNHLIKFLFILSTVFLFYFQENLLKVNSIYILEILNIKQDQITIYTHGNVFNILFGGQYTNNKYGGDFAFIDFLNNNGLVFLFLYLYFFKSYFYKKELYFFLLCFSSLHYATFFSVTSQMLVGLFFCKNQIKGQCDA